MNIPEFQYQIDPITAAAVILGWMSTVWLLVKDYLRTRKKKSSLTANTEVNQRIYDVLQSLCLEYKALRVFLCQFSNGENFFTGQSIQAYTISHEWTHGEVRSRNAHRVPIDAVANGVIGQVMRDGVRKEFSFANMAKDLRDEIGPFDAKTSLYLRVTDGSRNRNMVAMLVFHWRESECLMSEESIRKIASHQVKDLETIFINNL